MKKILFIFTALSLCSCSSDDISEENSNNFDRSAMMQNMADNIIIPSFEDLASKINTLSVENEAFTVSPDPSSLSSLRAAYIDAYLSFQKVEMFNIGKADEIQYGFKMNVYPTNINDIESNIAGGSYDLLSVNNNDAIGFPALDYLLYGLGDSDDQILSLYSSNENSSGYLLYLSDNIEQMKDLTTQILNDWRTNYRDEFVAGTANNATSPINMMVNDYIFYYEKNLRANKIGIPAGVFSNEPLADRVEGFYSEQFSKQLALAALGASHDFFNGVSNTNPNGTAASLAGYTDALETIDPAANSVSLSSLINSQFDVARDQLDTLNPDLKSQVETNNTAMLQTYDELQRIVVLLKVDMLQTLNISVDYVDADGD